MSADTGLLRRRPPPALPVLVLTGFLGAGKTTLLNGWIRSGAFADAAVVINEFGEIGVDHLLVEQTEGTMLTLSSGCLCCSVRGDLMDTLEDLIRRRDNGRVTPFNRVVIETTGLADPGPVLNALMAHPYLPLRYRIDAVVTVVDAVHGAATLDAHAEARSQVAVADTIVLTKTDLTAGRASGGDLTARLDALNPVARRLDASAGQASAAAVLEAGLSGLDPGPAQSRRWLDPASYADPHDAHSHDDHDHGEHHHHGIGSICLTRDAPLDPTTLGLFLDLVRGTYGAKILRIKGLVGLADAPDRPRVIHGVQHLMHPPHNLPAWPDADHRSRLVFILDHLDPALIARTWDAFFGPPAPDRPDAAGLLEGRSRQGGLLS
jgi:G3E family GTPase